MTVSKVVKNRMFLEHFNPDCKAMEDYRQVFSILLPVLDQSELEVKSLSANTY